MEYIQCPHCEKKYAVNDKLKAAAGKLTRCKHCQATFTISIEQTGTEELQEPAVEDGSAVKTETTAQPEATNRPDESEKPSHEEVTPEKSVKKKTSGKKGLNIQMVITIVLAVILIIGSITTYLFFFNPELFNPAIKKESSHTIAPVIPTIDPFARPIIPVHKPEVAPVEAPAENIAPATHNGQDAVTPAVDPAIAGGNSNQNAQAADATQACKDAAAGFWVRTHKLAHTRLSGEMYYTLFEQGVNQTAEIRTLCKDSSLVAGLTTAARAETVPEWIRVEVEGQMEIETARQKQLESAKH